VDLHLHRVHFLVIIIIIIIVMISIMSALVCFWSTTASDPDLASTYRQYLCAAGILCSRSRVHIDSEVSLRTHVTATVRSCVAALRQIRSVRRCLPQHALLTLIRALVVSKVDYCCSVLADVSGHLLDRLQSILNADARLVFSVRCSERITPLLRDLHW